MAMRFENNLQAPNFTVKNIDILNVSRPKDYKYSHRKGRPKHGFVYTVQGMMRDTFYADGETHIDVKAGEEVTVMAATYERISISELQPGDLVFYGKKSDKQINHVGIYIGNDKIIHSSTNYKGIAISSMYFSSNLSILKCCRILDKDQ